MIVLDTVLPNADPSLCPFSARKKACSEVCHNRQSHVSALGLLCECCHADFGIGAVFHYGKNPNSTVADITTAFRLLEPALGNKIAPKLFAVALLCSGQQATITGKQVNSDDSLCFNS